MTKGLSSSRAGRSAAAGILVALLVIVVGHGPALAGKRRVGISLNGPHASAVHDAIAGALKHHGFETTSADLSGDSESAIAAAAKAGKLAAVIVGEVRDGGKRFKLRVYGSGGDLIGEGSWSEAGGIKKLVAVVERTLWARIGGSLTKARAAGGDKSDAKADKSDNAEQGGDEGAASAGAGGASPEKTPTYSRSKDSGSPAPAEESESPRKRKKKHAAATEEAEAPEEGPTGPAATALDLAVGPRFVARSFSWSPEVPALRGYSLGLAPSVGANIAWYPAAHFRGGWVSNVGIATAIEYTPGLVSQTSDGSRYPTSESDYWGGARGRLIFGPAQASLTLGAGQHTFIFHSNGPATPRSGLADLPDVQYTYARAGVDVRVALPSNLSLMLGGGYRYVLNAGTQNFLIQANSYFPNAKFLAFDATAALGYKFLSMLEARAGFDLRRYQMTAGANPNGFTVNSATDQYIGLWLQLAVLVDGFAAGEGGPAGQAPKASKHTGTDTDDEAGSETPKKEKKGGDDDE